MKQKTRLAIFSIALVVLACGHLSPGRSAGEIETSDSQTTFRVETVIGGLEVPWDIVWTPDGRMLFTERAGRLRVFENGKLRAEPLFQVPYVEASGDGGLLSIALHPQFASNHFLYLSYTYKGYAGNARVTRYRVTGSSLVDPKVIIEDLPAQPHAGCRVRFGPDGKLYITTGDMNQVDLAQLWYQLAGKTLRLNDDGSIPPDNPFIGQAYARPEIWTVGHRNALGIDWQPGTNLLFDTEYGPGDFERAVGGDEVNILERGKNYGWPVIHHRATREGMESPLLEYTPPCGPASAMFYRGSAFPQFRGNFFFGCLVGTRIIRVVLDGRRVISQENLLAGKYGRIRAMAEGPDGFIYFSTSNRDGHGSTASDDDRMMRLVPVR